MLSAPDVFAEFTPDSAPMPPERHELVEVMTTDEVTVHEKPHWLARMIEHGVRCESRSDLQAHHLVLLRQSGSMGPKDGVCLCRTHHWQVECAARLKQTPRQ